MLTAGHWPLDTGRWPLDSGHWLRVTGCWHLADGDWQLITHDTQAWILDTRYEMPDTGTGCRTWVFDLRILDDRCLIRNTRYLVFSMRIKLYRVQSDGLRVGVSDKILFVWICVPALI